MHQRQDPREIITPEAFAIDPALIGLPLARPWRRAAAILCDLLFVAVLVWAGSIFFAAAAAVTLFMASARRTGGGFLRRATRYSLRVAGAIALFVTVLSAWHALPSRGSKAEPGPARHAAAYADDYTALQTAMAQEVRPESVAGHVAGTADSLELIALAYTEALSAGDDAQAAVLRGRLEEHAAAPRIAPLEADRRRLARRSEQLAEQLRSARSTRGRISLFLSRAASDLGLGFGWSGLYFTAFTVLLRGQTPGKRLLAIRVVRLDGQRIGWWSAFGRFGGYYASLATGLLGFAEMLWDRNRQTLQDKLADTVVIRVSGQAGAAPPLPRS
jgi:hypothetical protein